MQSPILHKVPNTFPSIRDIRLYTLTPSESGPKLTGTDLRTSAHFDTPNSIAMFTFP
jgi:hypothetical protein